MYTSYGPCNVQHIEKGANHSKKIINGFDRRGDIEKNSVSKFLSALLSLGAG